MLTCDFTLGSSSLLRGVPTDTVLLHRYNIGVLIAPTRSSNTRPAHLCKTLAGPHRSYEEFQPPGRAPEPT